MEGSELSPSRMRTVVKLSSIGSPAEAFHRGHDAIMADDINNARMFFMTLSKLIKIKRKRLRRHTAPHTAFSALKFNPYSNNYSCASP